MSHRLLLPCWAAANGPACACWEGQQQPVRAEHSQRRSLQWCLSPAHSTPAAPLQEGTLHLAQAPGPLGTRPPTGHTVAPLGQLSGLSPRPVQCRQQLGRWQQQQQEQPTSRYRPPARPALSRSWILELKCWQPPADEISRENSVEEKKQGSGSSIISGKGRRAGGAKRNVQARQELPPGPPRGHSPGGGEPCSRAALCHSRALCHRRGLGCLLVPGGLDGRGHRGKHRLHAVLAVDLQAGRQGGGGAQDTVTGAQRTLAQNTRHPRVGEA